MGPLFIVYGEKTEHGSRWGGCSQVFGGVFFARKRENAAFVKGSKNMPRRFGGGGRKRQNKGKFVQRNGKRGVVCQAGGKKPQRPCPKRQRGGTVRKERQSGHIRIVKSVPKKKPKKLRRGGSGNYQGSRG